MARHVDELLALLIRSPSCRKWRPALDGRMLGEYREKIIGEYSRLLLAEHVSEASRRWKAGR